MKTVVALWHSKDKGKTDTLRELARLLLAHSTCNTILSIPLEIRDDMDFRLIIEINKRRIGIESQGDPDTDIEKRLIELAVSCDFIICATRTKGETVSAVNRLCQDNKL
jgi:hypothetical protein